MRAIRTMLANAAIIAAALASPYAAAHAVLKASEPQAGAVLSSPPQQVVLTFNEKIEPAFSSVTVSNEQGKPITTEKAVPAAGNPAVLTLQVPVLSAGVYSVKWAVAGHDGHRRTGDFKFTVK